MSGQSSNQATLPDPQEAYAHLFTNVHQRAFFHKLASHGIEPQTPKEAQDLLELAGKLRVAAEDPSVKQAMAGDDSRFGAANAALDNLLGQEPAYKQAQAQEQTVAIKQAAAHLAQDPDIYNSVLALKVAEAEALMAQQGDQQDDNSDD
jgi:hypothetical protein